MIITLTTILKVRVLSGGVDKKTEDEDHPAGSRVHVYKPSDEIKPCFGHLALLYRYVLLDMLGFFMYRRMFVVSFIPVACDCLFVCL